MINKPAKLYHGSTHIISGPLYPLLRNNTPDSAHSKAAVFATERIDIAALFMFPIEHISSIGFEEKTAYICIWGLRQEFKEDATGYIYELPADSFQKIGKGYEYQSFEVVRPKSVKVFNSVIEGMITCGVEVYFINDETIFDNIVTNKEYRTPILRTLISENQKLLQDNNKTSSIGFLAHPDTIP
jgi:hypothetical protein